MLVSMAEEGRHGVDIQYRRAVTVEGNPKAMQIVNRVFEPCDDEWRGLGLIPGSGLKIKPEFRHHDASEHFSINTPPAHEPAGCLCGEVLRGLKKPVDCKLFSTVCTPANPIGACMVSGEGACQAYFNYR
jgi:hydrogenase expression/formation protein HypD